MHTLLAQATVNAAVPTWQIVGIILSAVLGFASTVVSSLVFFTLKNLNDRMLGQEQEAAAMKDRLAACRQDCDRTIATALQDLDREKVSKEDWIRSEGYTRQLMERLSTTMSRMEGSLQSGIVGQNRKEG